MRANSKVGKPKTQMLGHPEEKWKEANFNGKSKNDSREKPRRLHFVKSEKNWDRIWRFPGKMEVLDRSLRRIIQFNQRRLQKLIINSIKAVWNSKKYDPKKPVPVEPHQNGDKQNVHEKKSVDYRFNL